MTAFSFDLFITPVSIEFISKFLSKKPCHTGKFGYLQDVQQGEACLTYIWEMSSAAPDFNYL